MRGEGDLTIQLDAADGTVRRVHLVAPQPPDLERHAAGLLAADAAEWVSSAFSLDRVAHQVAARRAVEMAVGLEVDLAERRYREARLRAERVQQHAFQLFLAWPGLTGKEPHSRALRRLRQAVDGLWATGRWKLDGPLLSWESPASATALVQWAMTHDEHAAHLIRYLFEHQLESAGQSDVPLAPMLHAAWFAEQVRAKDFVRQPVVNGAPREVGPLARLVDHPLVGDVLRTTGAGLLARFTARLVALAEDLQWLERAQSLRSVKPRKLPLRSGGGAAVVETVRGPLAHVVEVAGGRVASWKVVSPWQWNFHPEGPLVGALLGTPASGLQERTRWLVAGLDPCVTCHVEVHGSTGA
jgi:coenzyme F420-reducing hydrogenase alpha subunit